MRPSRKLSAQEMKMAKVHRIGTVEMLEVKSSGRRLYVNLDADLVNAFGIRKGDILKVEIKERHEPQQPGREGSDPGNATLYKKGRESPAEKPGGR